MNVTPNGIFGLLGLALLVGLGAEALTSKNTAGNITAASNGWSNIEQSALHP